MALPLYENDLEIGIVDANSMFSIRFSKSDTVPFNLRAQRLQALQSF